MRNQERSHKFTPPDKESSTTDGEIVDDFILESLLEEEIEQFEKLLRLQKLLKIIEKKPHYYI